MSITSAEPQSIGGRDEFDAFDLTARAGGGIAAAAAAVAVVAGVVHGFGRDDESMVGHAHIALGHAIPIVSFTLMIGLIVALLARTGRRCTPTQLAASGLAVVGLVLWSAESAIRSLGFYATAHVDLGVATKLGKVSAPALFEACFAISLIVVVVGLIGAFGAASRRGNVPAVAVGLIVLGTLGSFFAGPVGDGVLAIGLGWTAARLARNPVAS